jgi:hypothetical protein
VAAPAVRPQPPAQRRDPTRSQARAASRPFCDRENGAPPARIGPHKGADPLGLIATTNPRPRTRPPHPHLTAPETKPHADETTKHPPCLSGKARRPIPASGFEIDVRPIQAAELGDAKAAEQQGLDDYEPRDVVAVPRLRSSPRRTFRTSVSDAPSARARETADRLDVRMSSTFSHVSPWCCPSISRGAFGAAALSGGTLETGTPIDPAAGNDAVSEVIDEHVWPAVQEECGRHHLISHS